eukprot:s4028_g4.t2
MDFHDKDGMEFIDDGRFFSSVRKGFGHTVSEGPRRKGTGQKIFSSSQNSVFREGELSGSTMMSYPKWCATLVSMTLKTRTPFAAFLQRTIHVLRSSTSMVASTPTFFPVPAFNRGQFDRMPLGASSKKRRQLHLFQAVHVICMALNFWFFGGRWISDDDLRREPNAEHRVLFQRVASLIRSDGLAESFPMSLSGRKHPELLARLAELSQALTACGGACSCEKGFSGIPMPQSIPLSQELKPYADLNASRLRIHGTGHWDVTGLLSDDLVMAYREPRSLLADLELGSHPQCRDAEGEVVKLAKLWDRSGLLRIYDGHRPVGSLVKIFNCFKNAEVDRQIGDRRGQNSYECKVMGPSSNLPSGADMMDLQVDVKTQKVVVVITDRKDYYHQLAATPARYSTNSVGPAVHLDLLKDTKAYGAYMLAQAMKKRSKREVCGDALHSFSFHPGEAQSVEQLPPGCVWACFGSILQGDHAGVEIATSAHERWLQQFGLLDDYSRLVASRSLRSSRLLQGLVIDDYFAASVEEVSTLNADSRAAECYVMSQQAYKQAGLLGSPAKDVVGENEGKLVGAFVDSSSRALSRGLCTVGAPAMKRIALSFITLSLCNLACTTDVLHLCILGGWVSVLAYRRPLMSLLDKSYHLVDQYNLDANDPKIITLPRSVANELVLLAVLVPLALSDLGAEYCGKVFSTDASSDKGAICWADLSLPVVKTLWKTCRSKGSYTRILSPAEQVLRHNNLLEEEKLDIRPKVSPDRPIAFEFDFIEVFSGASLISERLSAMGLVVGPPLDIGISPEYNLAFPHVMAWLTHMLASKKLKAFMASPPCTTFSIMRRPRLRSAERPYGFNVDDPQTAIGNILGQRGGQLLHVAATNEAAGILETTFSSYLKHMPGWKSARGLPSAEEVRCDSCRFGSPHLKPFRFLGVNVSLRRLDLQCTCEGLHLRVQGSLTKASATYVPRLVDALAETFFEAIQSVQRKRVHDLDVEVSGLENQLVNEVALSAKWEVHSAWTFKKRSHINILEEASILRLVNFLSRSRRPLRAVALVDSYVVRGATSKGRSSSRALSTVLRRVCATSLAAALYLTLPYVPTRWNPSDDPTRDVELRPQYGSLNLSEWEEEDLFLLSELPKTRRWASIWVRMVLRLVGPSCLRLSDRSLYRQTALRRDEVRSFALQQKSFDASMGFPGEGPFSSHFPPLDFAECIKGIQAFSNGLSFSFAFSFLLLCCWIFIAITSTWTAAVLGGVLCLRARSPRWLWISVLFPMLLLSGAHAMPMFPKTAGERTKAAQRQLRPPVPPGRPVLPVTQQRRAKLLDAFLIWAVEEGLDVMTMLQQHHWYIDDLNLILERYGRSMYQCGKTYGGYAETLNAITSWKPALRRLLGGAWDFGYAWSRHEPSVHHSAMPGPVALAMITTAIIWGWTQFAGVFALMWAGLLRPGEALAATRADLLLPSDGDRTLPFGLLSIKDPKTRTTNARHQSAKIDMADMLRVVELFLGPLKPFQKLWPYSGNTLRSRFRCILQALQLPLVPHNDTRPLELASIRAGSATWLMQMVESGDLLQRRGRWANRKMMDIYIQEVTAQIYLQKVPAATKDIVLAVADSFLLVLNKAEALLRARIPMARRTRKRKKHPEPSPKRRARTAVPDHEGEAAEAGIARGRIAIGTARADETKGTGGSAAAPAAAAAAAGAGEDGSEFEELAKQVALQLEGAFHQAIFITGGLPGVQESFAKSCNPSTSKVYKLAPGSCSGCTLNGQTVKAGTTLREVQSVLACIGEVYITFAGDQEVAEQAGIAFSRGAAVVPVIRTGGASCSLWCSFISSGKFGFPAAALKKPAFLGKENWSFITSTDASDVATAAAIAAAVAGYARGQSRCEASSLMTRREQERMERMAASMMSWKGPPWLSPYMQKISPALELSGHFISVVGPPVCGFYAGLYNGYKALPREAATCLWGSFLESRHASFIMPGAASMTRMLLLTTLFPCLAADSLRGLGSAPSGNVTSMQKQLFAASSTAAACTAADEAKMTQLGSGNADGTFPKILSNCGKRNYNIFSGFNARRFVECVQGDTGLTYDCGVCFVGPARYGANNCKWSCLFGSWCGKSCLDCVGQATAESQQCAGVTVPTASACR